MLFAILTIEDVKALKQEIKKATKLKWYKRLMIIQLSSQGSSVPALARDFDLNPATIRSYIHDFNRGGISELRPRKSSGRKKQIKWTKAQWQDLMYQSPCDFSLLESEAKNWKQALLVQYFARYHHTSVSQTTISNSMRAAGVRWRRAKLKVHSPDPLYEVKKMRVESLRKKALNQTLTSADAEDPPPEEKTARLVYFDATDLHWCPDIGNGYTTIGQQEKVLSPGAENPWYALLGSMFYPSGEGLYTIHERKRSAEALAHFQLLIDCDTDTFWFVILDNATAHHTKAINAFVEANKTRIELVYLPTYSPHLNLIERLWGMMRAQITRNNFYESLQKLAEQAVSWLEKLTFSAFCSLMGVDESQLSFVQKHFE